MNKTTQIAINLQGQVSGYQKENLYTDLYLGLQSVISCTVNRYYKAFNGDIAEGESIALDCIMQAVEKFQYTGSEFATFYSHILENKLRDKVRSLRANKNRHNTSYEVSLSADYEGDEGKLVPLIERLDDNTLRVVDTYNIGAMAATVSDILDTYGKEYPENAEVLEILITHEKKSEMTAAVAAYYGQEKYNGTIQKRVSRVREHFTKYMTAKQG